jgi:glycosyltransferase involved in cell wall biosynthesis
MPASPKTLVVLSETLPLGGTATFSMNLCRGMSRREDWQCVAAGLRGLGEIGVQIREEGLRVLAPNCLAVLHEERIEDLYRQCEPLQPRAVAAGLGSGSFDFLRYVPAGCLRIGMIQSDDECVYDLVESYLPWIDIVVGVSTEICRKMQGRLGSRTTSVVVAQPYGVPMPEGPVKVAQRGPLKVLFLGRVIEEQKRVGLMARVMKRTLAEVPEIRWTIAGDGPELAAMKEDFAGEAERVRFLGNVPYAQVPGILPEHDVYFLCSDYEGLPLSLLESMGAGLVPVVSDLPSGISEVVNESNGIRVPIHDEDGYAAAVIRLAREPALRAAMSVRASAEVRESHSTDAMARRWVEMLEAHLPERVPLWNATCRATAPKELDGKWRFSPPMRPVRRLLKRMFQ